MLLLEDPVALVQKHLDEGAPYPELDVFASADARAIIDQVDRFCRQHLGSGLAGYLFYSGTVGSTHGVVLADGREVVVKIRPPTGSHPYLEHDRTNLETICLVMRWLQAQGYPCPQLLLGPTRVGNGLATVEAFLERGERGQPLDPDCQRTMAGALSALTELLRAIPHDVRRLQHLPRGSALYPQPHSRRFDFAGSASGAEWIDDLARRARRAEVATGPRVLGHADWRVEHVRFQGGRVVAAYDWDSLAFLPETELIGRSAAGFTADWSRPDGHRLPSRADIRFFIGAYAQRADRAFSRRERRSILASCVYWMAYGARCAHSLNAHIKEWSPDTWPYLLRTEGGALLAEATA
jgi:hypothetical protein